MSERNRSRLLPEQRRLEGKVLEAQEVVNDHFLPPADRLRLTRVLQIVERYKPAEVSQRVAEKERGFDALSFWRGMLESALRLIQTRYPTRFIADEGTRERALEQVSYASEHRSVARSYLLSEDMVRTLRKLRSLDRAVERDAGEHAIDLLDQPRSNTVVDKSLVTTGITLDYEKENWGIERVCLDGIQNHLPSDSGGQRVAVACLVNNEWHSLADVDVHDEVTAIRFADDGVGFDVKNLELLWSSKAGEKESVGQFGEGIKMLAAASLREKLDVEFESQNWRARPVAVKDEIQDPRRGRARKVERLAYQVQEVEGAPLVGSRTTFWKPSAELVRQVRTLHERVLPLQEGYRPLFVSQRGDIVSLDPGKIYVKGLFITEADTLLTYNFTEVGTNRDRNALVGANLDYHIGDILKELSDYRIVRALLQKSLSNDRAVECRAYYTDTQHPVAWKQGFARAFGADAVIDTGYVPPTHINYEMPKKVKLPDSLRRRLIEAGVQTDEKAIPDTYHERVPTSVTLEYGKEVWDEERIMLDALQNHLPGDSGGTALQIEVQSPDGGWHEYYHMSNFADKDIAGLRIRDNGRGYDHRLLGIFHSSKRGEDSAGKFGEGLKMLTAAAVRAGCPIELSSRRWSAVPQMEHSVIDGADVDQLVFDVTHQVKTEPQEGSCTTFTKPNPALIEEFRHIQDKALLSDHTFFDKTPHGDVLALEGGRLFVRRLLIPGEHGLLFSYHLPDFNIKNRDRNNIARPELAPAIARVVGATAAERVVETILVTAALSVSSGKHKDRLELTTPFTIEKQAEWKRIFQRLFGEETSLRDADDLDMDAIHQHEHLGLKVASFPKTVYEALARLGLPTYQERLEKMVDVNYIKETELTSAERRVLEVLRALDEFLPGNRTSPLQVYEQKYPGQKTAAGFSNREGVSMRRDMLADIATAADVYLHEKTHNNTDGAADASREFRDYLTLALSRLALTQLNQLRPELFLPPLDGD